MSLQPDTQTRPSCSSDVGALLICTALSKSFGDVKAVSDLSFRINPGETYGLLGPNGAGKTTAIQMITGILQPDAGEVVVAGARLTRRSTAARSRVGYVPQEIAIYPDLSATENLRFFGRLYGISRRDLRARIREVLQIVGLEDRATDLVSKYSGGMQRRLNIGIGLLHRPELLILDEPTVGVDPQSRYAILQSIDELGASGMAVLYTTHYMEEAERLCDRIGILDGGRLIAEGTTRELIARVGEFDQVHLGATGNLAVVARQLEQVPAVRKVTVTPSGIDLLIADARAALPAVLASASEAGAMVQAVMVAELDLEAVFMHLTGRTLRDGQ